MNDDIADDLNHKLNHYAFGCLKLLTIPLIAWLASQFALWVAGNMQGIGRFEGAVIILLSLIFAWQLVGPWIRKTVFHLDQSAQD
ncbi:MAG: hypothetical protein ACPG8W_17445 [Candidatus Promineifilaceae bacterium]